MTNVEQMWNRSGAVCAGMMTVYDWLWKSAAASVFEPISNSFLFFWSSSVSAFYKLAKRHPIAYEYVVIETVDISIHNYIEVYVSHNTYNDEVCIKSIRWTLCTVEQSKQ
jgi:hypothetical protein